MTPVEQPRAGNDKWIALGALAVLMALVVRNAWVTEDAYLTLRTIDNWVHGLGLRWNVDERVQAYTHPLWMLVMTLPYLVLRDAYAAALLSGLGVTLAAVGLLVYVARSSRHAVFAVMLLLLSRSFIDYSTSGLENPLSHLLLVWLVLLYAVKQAGVLPLSLCAALLALNRTDALLVAVAPLVHTLLLSYRSRGSKQTLKELLLGLSPYLAWELFSLFYYGFLVPNTAFAKLNTGIARGELARQGAAYLLSGVAWDPALLAIVVLGLGVAALQRQLRSGLVAASVLIYLLYVVQIGGDFMQGRFLTIPVMLCACLVAISPLGLQTGAQLAALLLPMSVLFFHPSATDLHHAYAGVEDEREFYEGSLGLMSMTRTQAVPHHVFRENGERFADTAAEAPVQVAFNVGITGFYAGPRVHVVDVNALSDPLLARLPIRHDPSWRIGHYTRAVPEGYLETVKDGHCRMQDTQLCNYYDKLYEIVSGDLWSWSRFKAIAVMNTGGYESWIDRERYRYPEVLHVSLAQLAIAIPEDAAWNDGRARVIPNDGIEVALGQLAHDAQVALSFDGNDSYEVFFKRGAQSVAVQSPKDGGGGLRTRILTTPPVMRQGGFDRLLIRPLGGDGMYSVGFVRVGVPQ